jgi:alcohol dehydrogenase
MSSAADLHFIPEVLFGRGVLERVGSAARGYGKRALVVTDPGLRASGIVERVIELLSGVGVESIVFDQVRPNPTIENVEAGLAAGSDHEITVLVSIGGGSAHDCAKTIALVAANGGEVSEFEGLDRSAHRGLPLIAVNTTAGSGADVSRFAVITDEGRRMKMIIADRHLVPRLAINDPLTTVSLPAAVTMASGLDALTHAIEAYVSTSASEISDLLALRAVELAGRHLVRAVRQGTDVEAREGMMLAALLAGLAINSASVGAVHALAHQLGGRYDLAHGVCNGILLPLVVEFNEATSQERYARVALALGRGGSQGGGRGLARALRSLGDEVGLPTGLAPLGVRSADLAGLAGQALNDMCMATNPRPMSEADVIGVYERAL